MNESEEYDDLTLAVYGYLQDFRQYSALTDAFVRRMLASGKGQESGIGLAAADLEGINAHSRRIFDETEAAASPPRKPRTARRTKAWKQFGVKPWKADTFKFSTDPELGAKVADVIGLYLAPPVNAVVLCVDEKSQIQALNRTQKVLPMQPGHAEQRTHDYVRHGTTTLFAALEVATGRVTGLCKNRHRHQEFLAFLRHVARAYPDQQLHVVMDNYAAHKRPEVRAWLRANPRIRVHFTTSASWLNLVEVWFGIIERQAIRRGVFPSVRDLMIKIRAFIDGWNSRKHPFIWTKTSDEVLAKIKRKQTSSAHH